MSGTTTLTLVGTWSDLCGDTIKQMFRHRAKVFTPTMAGKLSGNWKTDGEKGVGGRALKIYCGRNYGRGWSASIAGRFSWGRSGK